MVEYDNRIYKYEKTEFGNEVRDFIVKTSESGYFVSFYDKNFKCYEDRGCYIYWRSPKNTLIRVVLRDTYISNKYNVDYNELDYWRIKILDMMKKGY